MASTSVLSTALFFCPSVDSAVAPSSFEAGRVSVSLTVRDAGIEVVSGLSSTEKRVGLIEGDFLLDRGGEGGCEEDDLAFSTFTRMLIPLTVR